MNEQPDAAYLIRAKVLIGQLPRRTATKSWIAQGSGLSCDGCDRPITATDAEHAVDAIGLGTLRFHTRCMQLWEEASALPREIAGGSAPSACTLVFDLGVAREAAAAWPAPARGAPDGRRLVGRGALVAFALSQASRAPGLVRSVVFPIATGATALAKVTAHVRPPARYTAFRAGYATAAVVCGIVLAAGVTVRPFWNGAPATPPPLREPVSLSRSLEVAAPPSEARRSPNATPRRVGRSAPPRLVRVANVAHRPSVSSPRLSHASRRTEPLGVWREIVHQSP
jgi:hypothetical protein